MPQAENPNEDRKGNSNHTTIGECQLRSTFGFDGVGQAQSFCLILGFSATP